MKKLHLFSMVCLLTLLVISLAGCKKDDNGTNNKEYVDLSLPSGTKWKTSNERTASVYMDKFYTYEEAVSTFGDKLPTKEQFEELKNKCTWEWQRNGSYKVTGANGNFIVLPAAGIHQGFGGGTVGVSSQGYYWSSTTYDSESAWNLYFDSRNVGINNHNLRDGFAVRLVQD